MDDETGSLLTRYSCEVLRGAELERAEELIVRSHAAREYVEEMDDTFELMGRGDLRLLRAVAGPKQTLPVRLGRLLVRARELLARELGLEPRGKDGRWFDAVPELWTLMQAEAVTRGDSSSGGPVPPHRRWLSAMHCLEKGDPRLALLHFAAIQKARGELSRDANAMRGEIEAHLREVAGDE